MAANSTHPDYDAAAPQWSRARDVLSGEDAVKAAGKKYLPRMDSQNDVEYSAYKDRAAFFGATARTLEEYLDLVFRRAPTVGVGERKALGGFVADCDLWGMDFLRYARRVVSEVLSVGRAGSLLLWDDGGKRPWVSLWRAEDIVNWRVERVGQAAMLVELVLQEGDRLRVLRMVDGGCVQEFWKRIDPPSPVGSVATSPAPTVDASAASPCPAVDAALAGPPPTEDAPAASAPSPDGSVVASPPSPEVSAAVSEVWVLDETVTLKRDGVALAFIPFVFHGPRSSRPEPDRLPLADIIAANLDHYRLDADYKHGLHFAALPTAWVSGFNSAAELRIGSSRAWVSDVSDASAGFLEFSGAGLAYIERALDRAERRMALLEARMLEPAGVGATGLAASPDAGRDLCGLGSIVASLNQSLTRVLQLAHWWVEGGQVGDAPGVEFTMNTDLAVRVISGEVVTALVGAWRGGALSRESLLDFFKRYGVLPEGRTVAQERALIHRASGGAV